MVQRAAEIEREKVRNSESEEVEEEEECLARMK